MLRHADTVTKYSRKVGRHVRRQRLGMSKEDLHALSLFRGMAVRLGKQHKLHPRLPRDVESY